MIESQQEHGCKDGSVLRTLAAVAQHQSFGSHYPHEVVQNHL